MNEASKIETASVISACMQSKFTTIPLTLFHEKNKYEFKKKIIRVSSVLPRLHSFTTLQYEIDGFVQDCSISIANALEILQSCTKSSK